MKAYRRIMAAVDLSPEAKQVLARANELSQHYDAKLCLMHVVDSLIMDGDYELRPSLPLEVEKTLLQRAQGYLKALADDMGIPGVQQTVAVGSVKREILHYAQKQGCDLIVIGTHGRHGVAILLGSTANGVLHGTMCDVMCVRVGQ